MINFRSMKLSKESAQYLIESDSVTNIFIDEGSTISNKSYLILYDRHMFDGDPYNYYFDKTEVTSLTGDNIAETCPVNLITIMLVV